MNSERFVSDEIVHLIRRKVWDGAAGDFVEYLSRRQISTSGRRIKQ